MKNTLILTLALALLSFVAQDSYAQVIGKGKTTGKTETEEPTIQEEKPTQRPTLSGKRPTIIRPEVVDIDEAEEDEEHEGCEGHNHHKGKGHKYGHHKGKGHKHGHYKGRKHGHHKGKGHYKGKGKGHKHHDHSGHDHHGDRGHKPGVKGEKYPDNDRQAKPAGKKPSVGKGKKG